MRIVPRLALCLLLIAGTACSSKADAQTVRYEKPTTRGSDPFTDPAVATKPKAAFSEAAKKGKDTPFGGSGDIKVCDREKLIAFLDAHPDRKRAWTDILGVPTADFARYVRSLTPVILTADTRFTNHGFKNGKAFEVQSILAAGTAVLADHDGRIVVKCYCGNPLRPAIELDTFTCEGCPPNYEPDAPCTEDCYDCPDIGTCPSPEPQTFCEIEGCPDATPVEEYGPPVAEPPSEGGGEDAVAPDDGANTDDGGTGSITDPDEPPPEQTSSPNDDQSTSTNTSP